MSRFGYKTNNWSKVYFVQGDKGGPIKIGHTDNIENRLKQMQTGNPDKLVLLHLTNGGKNFEDELHERFSKYHYRGEWFHPSQELLDYINELKLKDENEDRILSIVELALAFGEILSTDEKKLLQEMVKGAKLDENGNWDKYKSILSYYNKYLADPRQFMNKYKKHLKL